MAFGQFTDMKSTIEAAGKPAALAVITWGFEFAKTKVNATDGEEVEKIRQQIAPHIDNSSQKLAMDAQSRALEVTKEKEGKEVYITEPRTKDSFNPARITIKFNDYDGVINEAIKNAAFLLIGWLKDAPEGLLRGKPDVPRTQFIGWVLDQCLGICALKNGAEKLERMKKLEVILRVMAKYQSFQSTGDKQLSMIIPNPLDYFRTKDPLAEETKIEIGKKSVHLTEQITAANKLLQNAINLEHQEIFSTAATESFKRLEDKTESTVPLIGKFILGNFGSQEVPESLDYSILVPNGNLPSVLVAGIQQVIGMPDLQTDTHLKEIHRQNAFISKLGGYRTTKLISVEEEVVEEKEVVEEQNELEKEEKVPTTVKEKKELPGSKEKVAGETTDTTNTQIFLDNLAKAELKNDGSVYAYKNRLTGEFFEYNPNFENDDKIEKITFASGFNPLYLKNDTTRKIAWKRFITMLRLADSLQRSIEIDKDFRKYSRQYGDTTTYLILQDVIEQTVNFDKTLWDSVITEIDKCKKARNDIWSSQKSKERKDTSKQDEGTIAVLEELIKLNKNSTDDIRQKITNAQEKVKTDIQNQKISCANDTQDMYKVFDEYGKKLEKLGTLSGTDIRKAQKAVETGKEVAFRRAHGIDQALRISNKKHETTPPSPKSPTGPSSTTRTEQSPSPTLLSTQTIIEGQSSESKKDNSKEFTESDTKQQEEKERKYHKEQSTTPLPEFQPLREKIRPLLETKNNIERNRYYKYQGRQDPKELVINYENGWTVNENKFNEKLAVLGIQTEEQVNSLPQLQRLGGILENEQFKTDLQDFYTRKDTEIQASSMYRQLLNEIHALGKIARKIKKNGSYGSEGTKVNSERAIRLMICEEMVNRFSAIALDINSEITYDQLEKMRFVLFGYLDLQKTRKKEVNHTFNNEIDKLIDRAILDVNKARDLVRQKELARSTFNEKIKRYKDINDGIIEEKKTIGNIISDLKAVKKFENLPLHVDYNGHRRPNEKEKTVVNLGELKSGSISLHDALNTEIRKFVYSDKFKHHNVIKKIQEIDEKIKNLYDQTQNWINLFNTHDEGNMKLATEQQVFLRKYFESKEESSAFATLLNDLEKTREELSKFNGIEFIRSELETSITHAYDILGQIIDKNKSHFEEQTAAAMFNKSKTFSTEEEKSLHKDPELSRVSVSANGLFGTETKDYEKYTEDEQALTRRIIHHYLKHDLFKQTTEEDPIKKANTCANTITYTNNYAEMIEKRAQILLDEKHVKNIVDGRKAAALLYISAGLDKNKQIVQKRTEQAADHLINNYSLADSKGYTVSSSWSSIFDTSPTGYCIVLLAVHKSLEVEFPSRNNTNTAVATKILDDCEEDAIRLKISTQEKEKQKKTRVPRSNSRSS